MRLDKKPKCEGCGEAGMNPVYYWWPSREKGGSLWHYDCLTKISEEINKARDPQTKRDLLQSLD